MGRVEVSFAPMFEGCEDLHETLYALLSSIQPGDFFALNAFLPFTGEGGELIEQIRHGVAESFGCVSCLEVGPRYLHSTGQLQKGSPNMGVFVILSADELKDIPLPEEAAAPVPWRAGEGPGCWRRRRSPSASAAACICICRTTPA